MSELRTNWASVVPAQQERQSLGDVVPGAIVAGPVTVHPGVGWTLTVSRSGSTMGWLYRPSL